MKNHMIIFDLDGTLIDSAPDVCRALNRTLTKIGRRDHTIAEVTSYLGFGAITLMEKALQTSGTLPDKETITDLTDQFLADYADNPVVDTVIFPGVLAALDQLQDNGARLALCTNKPSVTTAPVLELLNIDQYFQAIVCSDQVSNRKPHGDHIIDTISRAGGNEATRAIMIGDSESDINSAIHAGIPSVAVTFGYAHGTPQSLGATAMIDHFNELVTTIETVMALPQ
jgi:phosphoglycolate phosphatase